MIIAILPGQIDQLRAAYDDYMAAELGRLNVTAEALRAAAKAAGWTPGHELHVLPWVRHVLQLKGRL